MFDRLTGTISIYMICDLNIVLIHVEKCVKTLDEMLTLDVKKDN